MYFTRYAKLLQGAIMSLSIANVSAHSLFIDDDPECNVPDISSEYGPTSSRAYMKSAATTSDSTDNPGLFIDEENEATYQ